MNQSVSNFINHLSVEKGVSPHTTAAYCNDLSQFLQFLGHHGFTGTDTLYWDNVATDTITTYILELRKREYSQPTVARKIASIKSLFHYLVEEGVIKNNPAELVSMPRVGQRMPRALAVVDIELLLDEVTRATSPEADRDRAMLELLYATGMRVSELVSLDIRHVNLEEGYIRCMGKRSRERLIPFHQKALETLRIYIKNARPKLVVSGREPALFLNRRGHRLTRQGLWFVLKGYARKAGVDDHTTPHAIRHSFATHMLQGGASLRHVQELLGHANISTTQVYTHVAGTHTREQYDKAHPRA